MGEEAAKGDAWVVCMQSVGYPHGRAGFSSVASVLFCPALP